MAHTTGHAACCFCFAPRTMRPMGERLTMLGCRAEYAVSWGKEFLSTPSARRATAFGGNNPQGIQISIHVLREEGDAGVFSQIVDLGVFLSTPSVRRATPAAAPHGLFVNLFLSTPSVRRATAGVVLATHHPADFYPRPPRGGRLHAFNVVRPVLQFLPTPSARRATHPRYQRIGRVLFLPTPSARRATNSALAIGENWRISTHALREEGDRCYRHTVRSQNISTHALREEGDLALAASRPEQNIISIHALREEGDGLPHP